MITNKTKRSLKERSKLTKSYKNGQDKKDYEKLLENSSKEILEAKRNYILKMATKLQDRKTAAKTYWAILRGLIYKKKFQQYHLYLLMVNLPLIFGKKKVFSITFLRQYVHQ